MSNSTSMTALPPLGLDPEHHLLQREALARVLSELRRHRFGQAFLHRALDERQWQQIAEDIGVEPNTLTKAWTRLVERLRAAGEVRHG